jgi:hypothetical protein
MCAAGWEWSQWALTLLALGVAAMGGYELGRHGRLSRDVVSCAAALGASALLLHLGGFW